MSTLNPILLLAIFIFTSLIIYAVFRPKKGVYFLLKKNRQNTEKTAIEDILKFVYHNKKATLKEIENNLSYGSQMILQSIQKMLESSLLEKNDTKYLLTENGNNYALRIVRAHRLWEKYLSEKTGFSKEEWHGRAEEKEHELTHEQVEELAHLLGHPTYDPHGDPIPTKSGKIIERKGVDLSKVPVNSIGRIIHIEDEPAVVYKQIIAERIHLDSQIRVVENNENRVVFHAEGEEFVLAPIVAKNITILIEEEPVNTEENIMRLSSLALGETGTIIGISKECRGENRRRLLDLGFVKSAKVRIDLLNPLGDPKAFLIKGTTIALRANQSTKILITKDE